MNCKEVKYKILQKETEASVKKHITECESCRSFNSAFSKSIQEIKANKRTENDEFFYHRLKAKMENRKENSSVATFPKFKTAFISVLTVFAVVFGIGLGNKAMNTFESYSDLNQEVLIDELTNNIDDNLFVID